MSKGKPVKTAETQFEAIEPERVQEVVNLFVDFAEEKKIAAKIVLLAMEHIVEKIKNYLEIETVAVTDGSDTLH